MKTAAVLLVVLVSCLYVAYGLGLGARDPSRPTPPPRGWGSTAAVCHKWSE